MVTAAEEEFMALTQASEDVARFHLEAASGDLQSAVEAFFGKRRQITTTRRLLYTIICVRERSSFFHGDLLNSKISYILYLYPTRLWSSRKWK